MLKKINKPPSTRRPARSTVTPITLSITEARAIALRSQGLGDESARFGLGKAAVLKAIQHLGYVQVDPISVLQRAHHHVLWSRVPDYEPAMLHELQSPDIAVFEYWNHATSFLPVCDFRYSLPLMRKYRRQRHWFDPSPALESAMRRMLRLIRKDGPLKISDVASAGLVQAWSATSLGKIERRALHELWMRGEIMIRSRRGLQKIFDLPSRILPGTVDTTVPSRKEAAEFHLRRGLRALGVARALELHYLQDAGQASDARAALSRLIRNREAVEIRIPEFLPHSLFALREALTLSAPLRERRIRFLSPFDNLTIQRKRLKWLFDFDYSVEIYVPAAKRKYGYFVLPILFGDRLIGRMDAKADRVTRRLVIHNLVFEPALLDWPTTKPPFREALGDFAKFQGCDQWEVIRVAPDHCKIE